MKLTATIFGLLLVLLLPWYAQAQFSGGDGSSGNPWQVATATELNEVRNHFNDHFIQTADIDLDVAPYNTGSGWDPIGKYPNEFTGSYNGSGHKITGLFIHRPTTEYVGLFGDLESGSSVMALGLEGVNITGDERVGGLAGISRSNITGSYVTGGVSGNSLLGGLVGFNNGGSIANSYAMVAVSGGDFVGGVTGQNGGHITNSYATGAVSGSSGSRYIGGLVGTNYEGNVTGSYWNTETSGQSSSDGGTGLNTAQMRQKSNFSAFDFGSTWTIDAGSSYPYLQANKQTPHPGLPPVFAGAGTSDDPYQVATVAQLDSVRHHLGDYFIQTADIDLNVAPYNTGSGWLPIGKYPDYFTGNYNGNGHKITGLFINRPSMYKVGLFGYVDDSSITGVGLEDVDITGDQGTGGLVGHNQAGNISNSYVTGYVSGSNVGGLTGINSGTITNSYATSSVLGRSRNAGGLVGQNAYQATISNSYATGSVSGGSTGGLVGVDYSNNVTHSYWDRETSGQSSSDSGTGLTTAQMREQVSFSGFDFSSLWSIDNGNSYPYLKSNEQSPRPSPPLYAGGNGTPGDPYQVANARHLDNVRKNLSAYFILTADIDLNIAPYNSGAGWNPISNLTETINGNGHTISNLMIDRATTNNVGLFGYIDGGTLIGMVLENANVTGQNNTGGIVGNLASGSISTSYVSGTVTGGDVAGGIVGFNGGSVTNSYAIGSVTGGDAVGGLTGFNNGGSTDKSYAAAVVSGSGRTGGLVALVRNGGSATNSYWDTEISGQTGGEGGTGKTTAQMKTQSTFSGLDFTNTWAIESDGNVSYPYLKSNIPNNKPGLEKTYAAGTGTGADPYQISTALQLDRVRLNLSAYFILTADIDLNIAPYNSGAGWNPISNLTGTINGNGHTISNLMIDRGSRGNVGLFGYGVGTLTGIALEAIDITGGDNTGGLYGYMAGGTISESYTTGSVNGSSNTGGLVGQLQAAVSNSYSIASVNGGSSDNIGALIGINRGSIVKSYAAGAVTGSGSRVLGLVGYESGGSTSASYWDKETTGKTSSYGGSGKTTAQMKTQSTFSGLDFTNTWAIESGDYISYPYLKNTEPDQKPGHEAGPERPVFNTDANKAIRFNNNGYISLDRQSGISAGSGSDDFSISMWINTTSSGGALFGEFKDGSSHTRNYLSLSGGKLSFDQYLPSGGTTTFNTPVNTGAWIHVVYVQESGTRKVYVNGTQESTTASAEAYDGDSSDQFYLGYRGGGSSGNNFTGQMDEVSWWSKALSAAEINDLKSGAINQSDTNLLGYLSFDKSKTTDIIADVGMNGSMVDLDPETDRVAGPDISKPLSITVFSDATNGTVISDSVIQATQYTPSFEVTDADSGPFNFNSDGKFILTRNLSNTDTGIYTVAFKVTLEGIAYASEAVIHILGVNQAPVASNAAIDGTPKVGEELTASYTYSDADGDAESGSTFKWYRANDNTGSGETLISGATSKTYTLTSNDKGTYIAFEVTPNDGTDLGTAIKSNYAEAMGPPAPTQFAGGDGSFNNPWQVANATQLNKVRNHLSNYFIQIADIDLDVAPYNTGSGWAPIGDDTNKFKGIYNGNGHTITGLFINRPDTDYTGLFGYVDSGSSVRALGMEDVDITGALSTGGLAGENVGTITSSYATGTISGNRLVGGLVGFLSGTITNSYATASVSGSNRVGGLVGYLGGTISASYAAGSVSGSILPGGLVGQSTSGSTITSSYWNTETTGQSTSADGFNTTTNGGITTAQMHQQASFSGFNFNSTWAIESGTAISYPYLRSNVPDPKPGYTLVTPQILATTRQNPAGASTRASQVTFRTRFSQKVGNVDATDFIATGSAGGSVSAAAAVSDSLYDVTVSGLSTGTAGLAVKGTGSAGGSNNIKALLSATESAFIDHYSSASYVGGGEDVGQTFQPAASKMLSKVTVYFAAGSPGLSYAGPAIMNVYAGDFFTPGDTTLIASQNIIIGNSIGAGGQSFSLEGPVALSAGQTYSIIFSGFYSANGSIEFTNSNTGNEIASGRLILGSRTDLTDSDLSITLYDKATTLGAALATTAPATSESYTRQANTLPIASGVTFTGALKQGQALSGTYSYGDGDSDPESGTTFKWYRSDNAGGADKAVIGGATSSTYTLSSGDAGKYLSFEVTPSDGYSAGNAVESTLQGPVTSIFAGGDGTAGNPWKVATPTQLDSVRHHLSAYFIQIADIDLDVAPYNTGSGWLPIGNFDNRFTGSYNGGSHSITGLFINRPSTDNIGLFGFITSGSLSAVAMKDVSITGGGNTGGLAGYNGGNIGTSYVTGTISGSASVGGMVGANGGTITNNYATASISGSSKVGGLVGSLAGGNISASYAAGPVSGDSNAGGLVGQIIRSATINDSYWNTETTGQSTSASAGLTTTTTGGLTTAKMQQQASFIGFGFSSIWAIDEDSSYPYLQTNEQNPHPRFNIAPVASNVSISGALKIDSTLTANYNFSDTNNDDESGSTYKWYAADDNQGTNATFISGATTTSYTLTSTDEGKYLAFVVFPNDGTVVGDSAASAWQGPVNAQSPEIAVKGNTTEITNGDDSPTSSDSTFIGTASVSDSVRSATYWVLNTGDANLVLGNNAVSITGTNAADFAITTQPTATVETGDSTSFVILFDPSAAGPRNATVNITNNDTDENPFSFDISGTGNAAPQIANTVANQTTDEDQAIMPFSAVTLTDSEDDNIVLTVTLDDNFKGTLSGTGFTGTGPYTLSTNSTANAQAALRSLSFDPTDNRVLTGNTETTTFTINISDAFGTTTNTLTTVISTAVNQAPVITTTGGIVVYAEGTSAITVNTLITVADDDNTSFQSAKISIASGFVQSEDSLGFTNDNSTMGNISGSYDISTGVLTLSSAGATATDTQLQTALRAVTYVNKSNNPNTTDRTISFTINDGTANSPTGIQTIEIDASNDKPVATNLTISGILRVDSTLTASYDYSDAEGDTESGSTFQWYRSDDVSGTNKTAITDANSTTYTLTNAEKDAYISVTVVPVDGTDTGVSVESSLKGPVEINLNSDGNIINSPVIAEPVSLSTLANTQDKSVDIFDFSITDGGTDTNPLSVSALVLHTGGTVDAGKLNYRLSGPDADNVNGTYDVNNDNITFSELNISVTDGGSETYIINAYYNDNTGLIEGQTLSLSIDGDTDLTIGVSGTQMGATEPVTNGTGSTVDVTATQLVFTTQPAGSVSGSPLTTQPVVEARDAAGNTDSDFSETVTLTEVSTGTLTNTTTTASSGIAEFSNLTYTATADQQSFTLTVNDQDGTGSDLIKTDANAIIADVVATKLIFSTQPVPVSVQNGVATNFTTVPVVQAVDANNVTDTDYSTDITLAEINGAGTALLSGNGDTDTDNTTISFAPVSGTATFTELQITYTASGSNNENFNLQASSGGLTQTTGNQLTALVNQAPVVANDQASTDEDDSVTINVLANDSDAEDNLDPTSVSIGSAPTNGIAKANTTGTIIYTPNANYNGSDSFTYTVKDANGDISTAATVTITVYPVNDAPVITGTPITSVSQGIAYSFTPTINYLENDVLTFSITNKPTWASFDITTGELSGTPGNDDVGITSNVSISVADESGGTNNLANFNITVDNINDAPTITNIADQTIDEDSTTGVLAFSINDVDTDLSNLTLTASSDNQALLPVDSLYISGNNAKRTLEAIPTVNQSGVAIITLKVSDGNKEALISFKLTVTAQNDSPLITGTPARVIKQEVDYSFTPVVSDPEDDDLTFSITNKPTWASFNTATGQLLGTPANVNVGTTSSVTIIVTDDNGASSSLPAFDLTVENVNEAPIVDAGVADTTATENTAFNYAIPANAFGDSDENDTIILSFTNLPEGLSFDPSTNTINGMPTDVNLGANTITVTATDAADENVITTFELTIKPEVPGKVVLAKPANESINISLQPQLEWEQVSAADAYEIQITTDATFNQDEIILSQSSISKAVYTLPDALVRNTLYFWRVRATNADVSGDWSEPFSFTTVPNVPTKVVLAEPTEQAGDVLLKPTLKWEATGSAESYELRFSTVQNFKSTLIKEPSLTASSFELEENLSFSTAYYWQVRGKNPGGNGEWSDVHSFTTIPRVPDPVVLGSPKNNEGSVSRTTLFEWQTLASAATYELQVSQSSEFGDLQISAPDISENTFGADGELDDNTAYFWRVRGSNSGGTGAWSEVSTFITEAVVPELIFPSEEEQDISIAPTLSWQSSYEEIRFRVQLSTEENMQTLVTDTLITSTNVSLEALQTNTTYYWSVRVETEATASAPASPRSFTTRMPIPDESITTEIVFNNSGNENSNDFADFDYRLIGLPGGENIIAGQLIPGEYGTDWKLFKDTGEAENFLLEYSPDNPLFFEPGVGYWVLSKEPVEITRDFSAISISDDDTYSISLRTGWNIISIPFTRAVTWEDVENFNDFSTTLYGYEGSYFEADTLQPFTAYYVYNASDFSVDLKIPYSQPIKRENTSVEQRETTTNGTNKQSLAQLFVTALDDELTSNVNITYPEGSAASKAPDYHPPTDLSKFSMSLLQQDEENREKILHSINGSLSEAGHYTVEVKSVNKSDLQWRANLQNLPSDFGIMLVNKQNGRTKILHDGEEWFYTIDKENITLEIYTGTLAQLKDVQSELLPPEITLEQNYANPFSTSTTIRYGLTKQDKIKLEIFDILGRKVDTLIDGMQPAGWQEISFNANNLASGIYVYRLIAGKKVITKKMTIIK